MTAENKTDRRIDWIDTVRGIGIILVVLGHQYTSDTFALTYIFSFHMPLFFFISGYLFQSRRYSGFSDVIKEKARTRIVPYLFFFLAAYAIAVARVSSVTGMNVLAVIAADHYRPMFFQKMMILLQSSGEALKNIHNVALWFIPCLFVTELLFYALHRWTAGEGKKMGTALFLAALGGYAESILGNRSLPWAMDTSLTAVVFYGLGNGYHGLKLPHGAWCSGNKGKALLVFCLSTIACMYFARVNGRVDMSSNQYGNILYFYAAALSGIVSWLVIAPLFSKQPLLHFLGKNTLVIMAANLYLFEYATQALNMLSSLFVPEDKTISIQEDLYVFLISSLVLVLCAPIAYGINRFIPFVLGKKGRVRVTTV